jgi:hypothetical protein
MDQEEPSQESLAEMPEVDMSGARRGHYAEPEFFSARCDWCHIEVRNPVQPPHLVKLADVPLGDVTEWHIDLECYTFLLRLISQLGKTADALGSDKASYDHQD